MGLPFLPVRGVKGTGIRDLHPEYAEVTCPFTGEVLVAVPALAPDVALIHAPMGDRAGNLHLEQPYVLDERFAAASAAVVATVDRVVSTEEVTKAGIVIPAYRVAALAEAPFGAHPASAYPGYAYDRAHLADWVTAASTADGAAAYLERYVTSVDEAGYRHLIGERRLARLTRYAESDAYWMSLYS